MNCQEFLGNPSNDVIYKNKHGWRRGTPSDGWSKFVLDFDKFITNIQGHTTESMYLTISRRYLPYYEIALWFMTVTIVQTKWRGVASGRVTWPKQGIPSQINLKIVFICGRFFCVFNRVIMQYLIISINIHSEIVVGANKPTVIVYNADLVDQNSLFLLAYDKHNSSWS